MSKLTQREIKIQLKDTISLRNDLSTRRRLRGTKAAQPWGWSPSESDIARLDAEIKKFKEALKGAGEEL